MLLSFYTRQAKHVVYDLAMNLKNCSALKYTPQEDPKAMLRV